MASKRNNPTLSLVFPTNATFILLVLLVAGKSTAAAAATTGDKSPAASTALSKLCMDADFPQLCEEITKGASDAKNATQMVIQALSLRAAHAKALAVKLGSTATGYLKSSLDTCMAVYDDAVDNLQTSLDNLESGDKGSLFSNLSAVLSDLATCDDTIKGGEDHPHALLGKSNRVMHKLGSNCLALADEIHF